MVFLIVLGDLIKRPLELLEAELPLFPSSIALAMLCRPVNKGNLIHSQSLLQEELGWTITTICRSLLIQKS